MLSFASTCIDIERACKCLVLHCMIRCTYLCLIIVCCFGGSVSLCFCLHFALMFSTTRRYLLLSSLSSPATTTVNVAVLVMQQWSNVTLCSLLLILWEKHRHCAGQCWQRQMSAMLSKQRSVNRVSRAWNDTRSFCASLKQGDIITSLCVIETLCTVVNVYSFFLY